MRAIMKRYGLKRYGRFAACLLTAVFLLLFTIPASVRAADSGCDPQYMQALKGRATIEAQRQSAKNKNFIYKADSVLEYSCIFSFIEHGKSHTSMPVSAGAWDHIITTPAFNFLANSFGHVYLGGHFPAGAPNLPPDTYLCDAMARMWEFGRCINMNQYSGAEGFFDFTWYMATDPRQFPADYAACTPILAKDALNRDNLNLIDAFNGKQAQWLMHPDLAADGNGYAIDPVTTNQNLISWDTATGGNGECGAPIPTGLTIYRKDTSYEDYICAKPGCTYVPGTPGQCVK